MKIHDIPRIARHARRWTEVIGVLGRHGLAEWMDRVGFEGNGYLRGLVVDPALLDRSRAERIRLALTELGTAAIKFGQMLSTRADLVGSEIADELKSLQDAVPPDPPETTFATLEAEFCRPMAEIFATFEPEPFASASIAQAHRALLRDGRRAVVKIQHPGLEIRLRNDLEILKGVAESVERAGELKHYRPAALVEEFSRQLMRELDFSVEERHLATLSANFSGDPAVRFPEAFPGFCTRRVLTMEELDGVSLRHPDRLGGEPSRKELAMRGATIWLNMIFRDGFYHADPHPGNILILNNGVIGIIDAGMSARLDDSTRDGLMEALWAIAENDTRRLARLLVSLCGESAGFDERVFETDVAEFVSCFGSLRVGRLNLGDALGELTGILHRHRLRIPSSLSLLIRTFVLLEGSARQLDPDIAIVGLIERYWHDAMLLRLSPRHQIKQIGRRLREWQHMADQMPGLINVLIRRVRDDQFTVRLEHNGLQPHVNRLTMGILTSSLFLGSSWLWCGKVPPLIGDIPVVAAVGCMVSAVISLRLLRSVWNIK